MPQSKVQYVRNIQDASARLMVLLQQAADLEGSYFDRTYQSGAADEITDQNLQQELPEITAAEVAAGITMLQQFQNFMNNQPVVQGDYAATANKLRNDY